MTHRAILHIDMDAFFAAVEVLDDPSLQGKPVIVGGTPEGRGVVAAASYEAREYGVHSAMSAAKAVKLCPHGVFLPGRRHRYIEVSKQMMTICKEYTPLVEPISIDEAFLDVTGSQRLFGKAEEIGLNLKRHLKTELGLTASVGIGPNKFLAKLASDLDKPDGFFVFTKENARKILADLPINRLWGVGPATHQVLRDLNVERIGDLLVLPRQQLIDQLGDAAERLLELAVGRDDRPVIASHKAKSMGHEVTFPVDIAAGEELRDILDQLAAQVARRLRDAHLLTRTVHLKARFPDFTTLTRAVTLPEPTDATVIIRDTARSLLAQRLERRGRPLRLIGVSVSNLVHPEEGPQELFGDPGLAREKKIDQLLDQVQGKFGTGIVRRGTGRKQD